MSRFVLSLAALPLLVIAACAERPQAPRVPVDATTEDVRVLGGEWHGEFWGVDGRSGPIRFELSAEEGETIARGDVTMFGRKIGHELQPANPGRPGVISETLAISFVRVDASTETVTGAMEPYRDPECDCVVTTTFTGVISGDRIHGTWLTRAGASFLPRSGRWEVRRQGAED